MSSRKMIFSDDTYYHVFNKTIDKKKLFIDHDLCNTFIDIIRYYRSNESTRSYSSLKLLSEDTRNHIFERVYKESTFKVNLLAYCLMPTHFHFILRQNTSYGIQKFMNDILNSFTRYFNIKYQRKGPLFLPTFKAVLINNDEQMKHVSRYVHLNPYSSNIVTDIQDLITYPYSSFKDYVNESSHLVQKEFILQLFDNNVNRYKEFILQNADYQKTLEWAKHTEKW